MTRALALALLAALALPGCNLQPLYAGGGKGAVAQALSGVEVAPIPGQAGWLMRNALNDRLAAAGSGEKRYRLEVELEGPDSQRRELRGAVGRHGSSHSAFVRKNFVVISSPRRSTLASMFALEFFVPSTCG